MNILYNTVSFDLCSCDNAFKFSLSDSKIYFLKNSES